MSFLAAALAALALQSGVGAPSDVPRNHWAFKDVDELFRAGLLDGYPAQPLVLDRKIKFDQAFVDRTLARLKEEGLLVGYPDGLRGTPSRYEYAVGAHAAYANIRGESVQGDHDPHAVDEIPDVIKLFSMFEPELTKLGADVKACVRDMNLIRQSKSAKFKG